MPESPQAMSYRGKWDREGMRVEKDNGLNSLAFKYLNFANFIKINGKQTLQGPSRHWQMRSEKLKLHWLHCKSTPNLDREGEHVAAHLFSYSSFFNKCLISKKIKHTHRSLKVKQY